MATYSFFQTAAIAVRSTFRAATGNVMRRIAIRWGRDNSGTATGGIRYQVINSIGGATPTDNNIDQLNSRSPAPTNHIATAWGTAQSNTGSALLFFSSNEQAPESEWHPPRPWAAIIVINSETQRLSEATAVADQNVSSDYYAEDQSYIPVRNLHRDRKSVV